MWACPTLATLSDGTTVRHDLLVGADGIRSEIRQLASTPFMGQGRAMAVEDAVLLADMLASDGDLEETLQAFGKARYPLCKFVQDASRKVGEAGANEDAAFLQARNDNMKRSAQQNVDAFHGKLEALRGTGR